MPELVVDFITSLDGYAAAISGATGRERIYDGYPDPALDMVDSRTFDGQIQLVEYVPTVLDGPSGTS